MKKPNNITLLGIVSTVFLSGCTAIRPYYPIVYDPSFSSQPTYLCEGEEVNLSWDATVVGEATSQVLLTRRPGGVIEVTGGTPSAGSTSFVPRQPASPDGIARTDIDFLSILNFPDDTRSIYSSSSAALVIGEEAAMPHREAFAWGCDNAPGGGAGWSRVDYERGQIASATARITSVRNAGTTPVIVGMTRGSEVLYTMMPLGIGESTTIFNGEFWGVWQAIPQPDDYGEEDGCEDERNPEEVIFLPPDEPPVFIVPRPDAELEFQLVCGLF